MGGGAAIKTKGAESSTTKTTTTGFHTRPVSSKSSLQKATKSPSIISGTSILKPKADRKVVNKQADRFYRELTIRKHFCVWIE
jgi:hypothetical protein